MAVFPKIPPHVEEILSCLADQGFAAFIVGGCVRDALLGREPHDWDVATSATDAQISALFPRTVPTGVKYGTVTVLSPGGAVEVTTFRRDGAYLDGRRPGSVDFTGDLREDLQRRDFTVNAMAADRSGAVIDLFGGREDLAAGILRCVGDPERRFSEDALRMLRAVRFSAQLGFEIEEKTRAALQHLAPLAKKLSAERVRDELCRLLATPEPEAVRLMAEYGLLDAYLSGRPGNVPYERLRAVPEEARLPVLALLFSGAGVCGSAGELLRALRCPARLVRTVNRAGELLPDISSDPLSLRLALADGADDALLLAAGAAGFYDDALRETALHAFTRPGELAVDGNDLRALGLTGPQIGGALRALALAVTAGEVANTPASLLAAVRSGRLQKPPR